MKKFIVVQIAFLIVGSYTASNCSEWIRDPLGKIQQTRWYQRMNPQKPTYYYSYSHWLVSRKPSLLEYSEYTPRTISERNNLSKAEYEGVSPWAISHLEHVRQALKEEARGLIEADSLDSNAYAYSKIQKIWDPAEFQRQNEELLQRQQLACEHCDQLYQFIQHQENYLRMRQRYKRRQSLLNRPSFGISGKDQYGRKLSYPETPYSPYGD